MWRFDPTITFTPSREFRDGQEQKETRCREPSHGTAVVTLEEHMGKKTARAFGSLGMCRVSV